MVFTASDVLLKTLIEAGITHAFVNLGSDHPSLLEAFIHLRDAGETRLEFITSPNELRSLFMLIVELNAVDQPAIVRQYMRHVGEIKTGKNTQDVVLRALQFANSEPKGPVYCWATREITEELLDPKAVPDVKISQNWPAIEPAGLSPSVVKTIAEALIGAKSPLIVTSYLGRNHTAVQELIKFVDVLGIPVFSSCPSTVNIPFNHPSHAGVAYGGKIDIVENADVILILDSDIPWVPLHTTPSSTTKIFHIDCDPLKERMAMHVFPSSIRAKADSSLALEQLNDYVATKTTLSASTIADRKSRLAEIHNNKNQALLQLEQPSPDGLLTTPQIVASFRQLAPKKSLVLNEAISNYPHVWNHFAPTSPGSLLTSGASSLGWALGAAIGASLAGQTGSQHKSDLLAVFVGDGSFLFNVPASSYWMARRYETPFLTVVLNNGGWKSPRLSMLGVHPEGLGSKSTARDLNVSFGPDELNVDYGAVAAAAGGAWCKKVLKSVHLELAMKEAIKVVTEEKRGFTPPPRPASSRLAGLGCLVGLTALRSGDFGVKRVGVVDQKALSLFKKESSATEKLASDGISAGASMTVVDICAEAKALEANGSPKVALAYQIYMNRDRSKTEQLMNEAIEGGCKAFFVTVDTATFGNRQSDFSYQKLPGNMDGTPRTEPNRDVFGYWDASLNWKEIAMDAGVAPLDVLIEIRQRDPTLLTDLEVYVDGGVRRGTDVLKALCLGAKGVGLGRPFLYAQSAYGEDGVVRTVRIMEEEIITGMRLLGAPTLKDLKPEMVQCLDRRYTRFQ
ncbi:acetolactate synthase [Pseudohyphozyma bogoriensis]|nr:acetolactate synthase [Pseudohyphozyma bogoriensis]